MGWGKQWRKTTQSEKGQITMAIDKIDQELARKQIAELTDALFVKYVENPDNATKRLLIRYMGGDFFSRVDKT